MNETNDDGFAGRRLLELECVCPRLAHDQSRDQCEADCDEPEECLHELYDSRVPSPDPARANDPKGDFAVSHDNSKANSPPACSRLASADRSGGKRVSRTGRISNNPRTSDRTQREIRLDDEPTRATTFVDPCRSNDSLPVRDLGPRSSGPRRLPAAGQSARQLVGRGTARNGRAPRGPTDRQV